MKKLEGAVNKVVILLGTNIGDRYKNLVEAHRLMTERIGEIVTSSKVYQSEPWGYESSLAFYNQAIIVETAFEPHALLFALKQIENDLGRVQRKSGEGYKDRLIDLDILFFGRLVMHEKDLIIPHPELQNRHFTLAPLLEIDADYVHPVSLKTIKLLYQECSDKSDVKVVEVS